MPWIRATKPTGSHRRSLIFTVRLATTSDQKRLAEVELDAAKRFKTLVDFAPVSADALFLDQTFDPNQLLALIEKQQVFVSQSDDNVVVGFVILSEKSGWAYIEEIDVLREYGQKGIGKALIERSFAWAKERGYKKIFLRTAANVPWNAPMYARFGFTKIDESDWSASMKAIDVEEHERGLPVADRIFMELVL